MIQMLRHEAVSGNIDDLAHVVSVDMMADVLTKTDCVSGLRALTQAVTTGLLPNVDAQVNFREMIKSSHKAFFCTWLLQPIDLNLANDIVTSFCGIDIADEYLQCIGRIPLQK